jgi:hypothetical protein
MSQSIGVLKFRLKLSQILFYGGTCEFNLFPPSLSGQSWDYHPAHLVTSFSGMMVSQDRGRRHFLVYVDDFLTTISTSTWVFKLSLTRALLRWRPEMASSFAHGPPLRDAEGRWC